jgi:hypothetical protein
MGYSYDIFSEKAGLPPPIPSRRTRARNFIRRKGGWKRLAIIATILLLCVIAIVVGVAVGLNQMNKSKEYVMLVA